MMRSESELQETNIKDSMTVKEGSPHLLTSSILNPSLETEPKMPIKVRSIKQIQNIQFIVEVLKKAKPLNTHSESHRNIFNIDDFLVEMAVLKTNKKLYTELVFYFKVKSQGKEWE